MGRGGPRRPEVSLLNLARPGQATARQGSSQGRCQHTEGTQLTYSTSEAEAGQALALEWGVLWGPIELSSQQVHHEGSIL